MYRIQRLKKKTKNYFYDHPKSRETLKLTYMLIITVFSGFIFAFGFNTFISPNFEMVEAVKQMQGVDFDITDVTIKHLASLGASGISQCLMSLLKIGNVAWISNETNFNILYWCFYFLVNLPLFFFGFFKVGKKFAIFSLLNVACASGFGMLLKSNDPHSFLNLVSAAMCTETVARVIFAGICTGIACGSAYVINATAGGVDIIAFFISEKKSVQVGKWSTLLNCFVVCSFSLLSTVPLNEELFPKGGEFGSIEIETAFIIFLFTVLYMVVVKLVVDTLNVKNKKYDVQIITPNYNLSQAIIAAIPRGCTIMNGKGGFSGKDIFVIHISVSKYEVKKVTKLVSQIDSQAFVNVIPMDQVYGRFYHKPIE